MDHLLALLRAAAEDTRLRILALAAREDLTVSDYVHVLGQSQPRVSRHLKLLVEAGLLERFREAQFTRFRLVTSSDDAALVREFVRRFRQMSKTILSGQPWHTNRVTHVRRLSLGLSECWRANEAPLACPVRSRVH